MIGLSSSLAQSTMKFALRRVLRAQSSKILSARLASSDSEYYSSSDSDYDAVQVPLVKRFAPFFSGQAVVDKKFKEISLTDFEGKYLVLFFYPLDFTFVCPTELTAFSDRIDEFKAIDCNVVGCSCDSHFTHLAWINTPRADGGLGDLKYPLLADFKKEIARSFNVLLPDDGIPLRGLFIIDGKGVVRQMTVNDLPVGRSVDEVLRLVKAFQFVDKNGEVCPANWQPNSPTIKPSPEASKEYFGKVNK